MLARSVCFLCMMRPLRVATLDHMAAASAPRINVRTTFSVTISGAQDSSEHRGLTVGYTYLSRTTHKHYPHSAGAYVWSETKVHEMPSENIIHAAG